MTGENSESDALGVEGVLRKARDERRRAAPSAVQHALLDLACRVASDDGPRRDALRDDGSSHPDGGLGNESHCRAPSTRSTRSPWTKTHGQEIRLQPMRQIEMNTEVTFFMVFMFFMVKKNELRTGPFVTEFSLAAMLKSRFRPLFIWVRRFQPLKNWGISSSSSPKAKAKPARPSMNPHLKK